jgi:phage terminase large subunit GpA-like protein
MLKLKKKTIKLFTNILKVLEPAPELTIGEWADRYRILSQESSAVSGKWVTDLIKMEYLLLINKEFIE